MPGENRRRYFQMWEPFRQSLLEEHRFYIEQGKKKLLSQFENMEQEASEAGKLWLQEHEHLFDPDRHDPGDFEENAYEESIEYYRLLSDLRDQIRFSLVAGMFHTWDKQLRKWLLGEFRHWGAGKSAEQKLWAVSFTKIEELLHGLGLARKDSTYLKRLRACSYVVNVYKHGDGDSLERLKAEHPEYLRPLFLGEDPLERAWLDHTHLEVTDAQFEEFSDSIAQFWQSIPESIDGETAEVPQWLEDALRKRP